MLLRPRYIFNAVSIALMFSMVFAVSPAQAAITLTVNTATDELNGDGDCSLREAIQAANTNTTVDNCVHDGSGGTDTIDFASGMTITLTGAAGEDLNASGDFDIREDVTIQNTSGGTVTVSGGGLDRVFHVTNSATAVFDGTTNTITITGGDNGAQKGGGILVDTGATLSLNTVSVSGNTAGGNYGGGIHNAGTINYIANSIISGNTTTAGVSGGGGISNTGIITLIDNTLFMNNNAGYAAATAGHGGGIINDDGVIGSITNTTFTGNTSTNGGGIYLTGASGSIGLISNSTFSGNTSISSTPGVGAGGAISIGDGTLSAVTYSTFVNNQTNGAANGQSIHNFGATFTTFTDSYVDSGSAGSNCIGAPAGTRIHDDDATCGTNDVSAGVDYVAALADNGCVTALPGGTCVGTHALLAGGDLVDPTGGANCAATDQRGTTRDTVCDIGAYELLVQPDLNIVKASDDSSESIGAIGGAAWDWAVTVSNEGTADAVFTTGQVILTDQLDTSTNLAYGTASIGGDSDITNVANISCSISAGDLLTCSASGATVTLGTGPGTFKVTIPVTAVAAGTYTNTGATCVVDPNTLIAEGDETNNNCADDSVTVVGPDLKIVKNNNVGNATSLGDISNGAWTWSLTASNTGSGVAVFADGETVFSDNLPSTNVTYGSVSVGAGTNTSGTLACSINGSFNLICTASGGTFSFGGTTGSIPISFTVTPSNDATYSNPRGGGSCGIDPTSKVTEDDESNNTCSDSVTVTGPDLSVTKSDSVSSSASVGIPFTWTLDVQNTGSSDATFASGETILTDNLDNSGNVSYGAVSITNSTDITGTIACSIASNNLTCVASGGPVIIGDAPGGFDVEITTTLLAAGGFNNPRGGGICRVDPGTKVTEGSEVNNDCSDSVTGNVADFTAIKTNNVSGSTTLGNNFVWTTRITNAGTGDAKLSQNMVLFVDDLPNTNITYGAVSIANVTGFSGAGAISCAEAADTITCTVVGGDITMASNGYFDVNITGTPTALGTYGNPRSGGDCKADPNNAYTLESNDSNNDCADSVTVNAPDLTVSKSGPEYAAPNSNFDWVLTIKNDGSKDATYTLNDVVLNDDMPAAGSYAAPTIGYAGGITGTISCTTPAPNMSCSADGSLTIPAGGSITITVSVTAPAVLGDLINPEAGTCEVDPNDNVPEGDETNNACAHTVIVGYAPIDPSPTKTAEPSKNTGSGGSKTNAGKVWLNIPAGAIPSSRDADKNACRVVVKEDAPASDYGFSIDEIVYDIKIFCDGEQVTQFDSPITICVKPLDGSNANKTLFHRHGGLTTFNALPNASGKSGWVCGTTSQLSLFLAGEYLLPETGFAPETVTELAAQPSELAYASTDIVLNIPKLGITQTIVGVPQSVEGWDVRWLGNGVGYLSGTAFPTWAGNTALTGHVWNADGSPGIFHALDQLQHGDQFTIEAWGLTYTYEVRESEQVYAHNLGVLEHSDYDVVTLITCEGYSEWSESYGYRRAVTAVLVDVK